MDVQGIEHNSHFSANYEHSDDLDTGQNARYNDKKGFF